GRGIIATAGVLQVFLYWFYAAALAHRFGPPGIAAAYSIYFDASIVWQLVLLRKWLGPSLTADLLPTSAKVLLAGAVALVVTQLSISVMPTVLHQFVAGALIGGTVYLALLSTIYKTESSALGAWVHHVVMQWFGRPQGARS